MFFLLTLYDDWGLLFLRLALGLILVVHGWPKVKNLKTTASNFAAMGFRPGFFWGTLIALLEFFGGLAFIVGFFMQPLAALFVIEFITAITWRISKHHAFAGGYELDLLMLAAFIALLLSGAGAFSLDHFFFFGGF